MSETLIAYIISALILAALALFVPCIDSVARLLRRPPDRKAEPSKAPSKAGIGRGEAV